MELYTILMLVNNGIPTGSEPGQSSQAGAELSTQPSEAPPCSFVHGYIHMYTTNVEHTSVCIALAAKLYIIILCLAIHPSRSPKRQADSKR